MFDIGWSELMVIGVIALIVVGPKDLPRMLRTLGQYTAQARSMAREFQRSMEDAAREADISDMKEMREMAGHLRDLKNFPRKSIDTLGKKADAPAAAKPAPKNAADPSPEAPSAAPQPASDTPPPREAQG
jgi:sec-independent protein translocase protein TatB